MEKKRLILSVSIMYKGLRMSILVLVICMHGCNVDKQSLFYYNIFLSFPVESMTEVSDWICIVFQLTVKYDWLVAEVLMKVSAILKLNCNGKFYLQRKLQHA
jgi:hypothetical protein